MKYGDNRSKSIDTTFKRYNPKYNLIKNKNIQDLSLRNSPSSLTNKKNSN